MFIYSDGGPDHRLTYLSVQLSLIALFLNLDLDILIAGRTAPSHSWANPVERIMSIVNLGMQCIGVMREKGGSDFEEAVKKSKNLKDIRINCSQFIPDVSVSLKPPKDLIGSIITRLPLATFLCSTELLLAFEGCLLQYPSKSIESQTPKLYGEL